MGHLHIFLIPMLAHGHMIPALDMAKLFTSRGLKTTIISTPAFSEPIRKAQNSGFHDIGLQILNFPPEKSQLPTHIVSLDQVTSEDLIPVFFDALSLLQDPLEKLIQQLNPTCLISDMFLPWTNCCAAKFNIPRLVFHGISYLSLCCSELMRRHRPFDDVSEPEGEFVLPNLPHEMRFLRSQVSDYILDEQDVFAKIMQQVRDSDWESYGVVVNSFYELEPNYAHFYKSVLGRKAWNIGPLLLYNRGKMERGKKSSIDTHECLAWLDTKKPHSVVYVCFGSMVNFTEAQLHETAYGLEASGQDFIWVVRKREINDDDDDEFLLPKGFVDRTKGRGLVIRGWAPQVDILGHGAVGAFVTHCGWNSTLEGVCAGVPMVTWPLFAEQFYNEKLVTEVLRIGVPVGSKTWRRVGSEGVCRDAVAKAVEEVLVDGPEMRSRVGRLKEMAGRAVEQGGSSYDDMSALIEDLSDIITNGAV